MASQLQSTRRKEAELAAQSIEIPDRYELKYLICEDEVDAIRRAIEPFCVLDPHAERAPGHEYPITSLYLDTPRHDLYRISRERRGFRWKARVRTYDGADVAFLEIKNKDHDLIKKARARVPLAGWAERLQGPPADDATAAERSFCEKVQLCPLEPVLMVRYEREAWMSTVDRYARVTFDRRVVCQPWSEWSLDWDGRNWLALDSSRSMLTVRRGVVLELKCMTAVPRWLSNVACLANLKRARYSKYCKGIERLFARDTLRGMLNST
jgi:hypothetical protein